MQLTQSPKFNRNYAAKIVEIKDFINHPNPKCERLKCCTIDGYSIAVSIDNLTSSQSTIRDADIAEVSSEYIRNQILQQASATLLATANQSPSFALQLI